MDSMISKNPTISPSTNPYTPNLTHRPVLISAGSLVRSNTSTPPPPTPPVSPLSMETASFDGETEEDESFSPSPPSAPDAIAVATVAVAAVSLGDTERAFLWWRWWWWNLGKIEWRDVSDCCWTGVEGVKFAAAAAAAALRFSCIERKTITNLSTTT